MIHNSGNGVAAVDDAWFEFAPQDNIFDLPVLLTPAEEMIWYLGTSRLEDSLQRYPVHMAFHGHAHGGTLEGRTSGGVPVYNVAMPLLLRQRKQAFRIFELPMQHEATPQLSAAAGA